MKTISILTGAILWSLFSSAGIGQIVPDTSLPSSSVILPDCVNCIISGGTQSGRNLFHSFERFSVPDGGRAYFNNSASVQNIFARVTGRLPSNINGEIRANGSANLFLLNPNGIIFGRNASLNLGGSFYAATGDRIRFQDGFEFSANPVSPSSLLTVSVPIGIQFGQNPGQIINGSQASRNGFVNTRGEPAGLQVETGQNLVLLGRGVRLDNGNLTARSGRISIIGIAPLSQVELTLDAESRFIPTYSNLLNLSDIELTRSQIDTSGFENSNLENNSTLSTPDQSGGAIQLRGRNISLRNESIITSSSYASTGGNLQVFGSESIALSSQSSLGTFAERVGNAGDMLVRTSDSITLTEVSSIASQARRSSSGNAGNLSIQTGQLLVQGGSAIEASTFGEGRGGNIRIQATAMEVTGANQRAFVDFDGNPIAAGRSTSSISSQADPGSGESGAGNITIATQRLQITDGGFISSTTFSPGDGGNLKINASESIMISGTSRFSTRNVGRSGVFVSAEPEATGNVGVLRMTTAQMTVADRAEIAANNRGSGQPGLATLNVGDLTLLSGGEVRASSIGNELNNFEAGRGGTLIINADTIQLSGNGRLPSESNRGIEQFPSSIAALTSSSGAAGSLRITTTSLRVVDRAEVSVRGDTLRRGILSGGAGNLRITASQILLNRGSLTASTDAGNGARINLQGLDVLLLRNQSQITAEAFNQGDGGNIDISAPDGVVIAVDNEDNNITANAFGGNGGNIRIDAQIQGLAEGRSLPNNRSNDIDASSRFGRPGTVSLLQPNTDLSRSVAELPTNVIDVSRLVAGECSTTGVATRTSSEFVITGRSGLPPNPLSSLNPEGMPLHWIALQEEQEGDYSSEELQNNRSLTLSSSQQLMNLVETDQPIEAQGWIRDEHGTITLVAQVPSTTLNPTDHHACQDQ